MKGNSKYLPSILIVMIAILVSVLIIGEVNSFIAIEYNEKDPATANQNIQVPHEITLPEVENITAIILPTNQTNYDMYNIASEELAKIITNRTGLTPLISNATINRPNGTIISVGSVDRNVLSVPLDIPGGFDNSSFIVNGTISGNNTITIQGGSPIGDVYGMFWLINELQTGLTLSNQSLTSIHYVSIPDSQFRLIGPGGLGMDGDPSLWGNDDYSLSNRRYENLFLVEAPYINATAFTELEQDFKKYVQLSIRNGYNFIRMSGFMNMINFAYVGDGHVIYEEDSEYIQRHNVTREALGSMFRYAKSLGMGVITGTDMVALSEPLKDYFENKYGSIDPTEPEFWDVYQDGIRELYDEVPLDGLMIRIGEAGSAYNTEEALYTSELVVKDVDQTKEMLNALIEVHEETNKQLIFRTWSVGIGEIGDMHTNVETYNLLLGDINSPNLIVSTKYTMGDFYAFLPYNPTLLIGEHKRIIEFQARREFEGFNAFPNYLATVHKQALQYFEENPNIIGIWLWSQAGGPPRISPRSLYPFVGFWLYTDANVYATSQLAWNWNADIGEITQSWVVKWFGTNPQLVTNYTRLMLLSPIVVEKGLYISEFAKQQVLAFGLEPPPMLWIFEWDIVVGVSSVLSAIYETVKDNLTAVINEGFEALEMVKTLQNLAAGFDTPTNLPNGWFAKIQESLQYQYSLFDTLAWYRSYFLNYYAWLDQGGSHYYNEFQIAKEEFESKKRHHINTYETNLDFPSYNFFEVETAMKIYKRNILMMWLARILLIMLVVFLSVSHPKFSHLPGSKQSKEMFMSIGDPTNSDANHSLSGFITGVVIYGLGLGIFTQFSAPIVTLSLLTLSIVPVILLSLVNLILSKKQNLANNFGINVILVMFLMLLSSIRGPSWFWYKFWTDNFIRGLFLAILVIGFFYKSFLFYQIQLNKQTGSRLHNNIWALGSTIIALGIWIFVLGSLLNISGMEVALTKLNHELLLIPFALSLILGITVHLDIPLTIPHELIITGISLVGIGTMVILIAYYLINRKST